MTRTFGGRDRRSPLGRVSNLLSSSTEFKFSTHSGSTSPSNMIHCRLLISPRTLSIIFLLISESKSLSLFVHYSKVCKLQFSLNGLPEYMSEKTISPFTGVRIKYTVKGFLGHCLRVDDMRHTFHTFEPVGYHLHEFQV